MQLSVIRQEALTFQPAPVTLVYRQDIGAGAHHGVRPDVCGIFARVFQRGFSFVVARTNAEFPAS
jgi:hypothetical protein